MKILKRGEKWGKGRTVAEIIMSKEHAEYVAARPKFSINIQQIAKTPVLLDCIVPAHGNKFVDLDITALEPVVTAELSGDPTYKEIYASGKPHDVYLFIAVRLMEMGREIDTVYNINNPTKESVGKAKKQFKPERSIAKVVHLSSGYGAGARKVRRILLLNGIEQALEEVSQLLKDYWSDKLFGKVKKWSAEIQEERGDRGGFILNGVGLPYAIPENKVKDCMNTVVQSTGHCLVDMWLANVWKLIEERGFYDKIWPVVDDFHDETILECAEEYAETAGQCLLDGLKMLNEELKPTIPLSGGVEIADSFTEVKGPDSIQWYTDLKETAK